MQTLLLALCAVAHAAPAADLVSSLPGWAGQLKSPMYSGYVDVQGMKVHYLFVECESKAPRDAPVLVWSNGGPGASSMFGLFVELGPYVMNEESLKTPTLTLFDNRYAWTKSGSVLMFDWPPPVGFSYCHDDPTGEGTSCGDWDDDRFSRVAYGALAAWYEKFPEFGGNGLYLTGESYAGIYIPRLAKSILEGGDASLKARLKGFAVGDACAGNQVNCGGESPWFNLLFLYGHGQISTKMFDKVHAVHKSFCGASMALMASSRRWRRGRRVASPLRLNHGLHAIDATSARLTGCFARRSRAPAARSTSSRAAPHQKDAAPC